jgi:aspartate 1-decarboxylase
MLRQFLLGKIHRATVTGKALDYEGSLGLDASLLAAAGMVAGEVVRVFNVTTGDRFETYLVPLTAGSREVKLFGAAARRGEVGDRLIILATAFAESAPAPKVVVLDDNNNILT